jgi:hypothetical protein
MTKVIIIGSGNVAASNHCFQNAENLGTEINWYKCIQGD